MTPETMRGDMPRQEPRPILVESMLPQRDHCHGADEPVITRVWYEPIADEI